jgi:hypothetical protein
MPSLIGKDPIWRLKFYILIDFENIKQKKNDFLSFCLQPSCTLQGGLWRTMADFHWKKLASVFLRFQENLNLPEAETLQILSPLYTWPTCKITDSKVLQTFLPSPPNFGGYGHLANFRSSLRQILTCRQKSEYAVVFSRKNYIKNGWSQFMAFLVLILFSWIIDKREIAFLWNAFTIVCILEITNVFNESSLFAFAMRYCAANVLLIISAVQYTKAQTIFILFVVEDLTCR